MWARILPFPPADASPGNGSEIRQGLERVSKEKGETFVTAMLAPGFPTTSHKWFQAWSESRGKLILWFIVTGRSWWRAEKEQPVQRSNGVMKGRMVCHGIPFPKFTPWLNLRLPQTHGYCWGTSNLWGGRCWFKQPSPHFMAPSQESIAASRMGGGCAGQEK